MVHDELDLPFGAIRVRKKGGAAGNHGMESVIGASGYGGICAGSAGYFTGTQVADGAGYVLAPLRKSQYEATAKLIEPVQRR